MPLFICSLSMAEEENDFFSILIKTTKEHCHYLSQTGLKERADEIQVSRFQPKNDGATVDLSLLESRMLIPNEVLEFDPTAKNTLLTTDQKLHENDPQEIKKILDIRLPPPLRGLIKSNCLQVFLGSRTEMEAYYKSKGVKILFEFKLPTSATYFLAQSKEEKYFVILSGLVSRENIIAQLLTLKLADIKMEQIEIIGQPSHFQYRVNQDMNHFLREIPEIKRGNHILIIAGCGLEKRVSQIIHTQLKGLLGKEQIFKGGILSLIYMPFLKPHNGIHGIICLDLKYGEIMEEIVQLFLDNCHSTHIFASGAGGYIPTEGGKKPSIGERLSITQCLNPKGERVTLEKTYPDKISRQQTHLQIPSIFLETYDWLEKAKKNGVSVDVETFYIIKAIETHQKKNPTVVIRADCGVFISDYVGEKPLREYSKVFEKYSHYLSVFLKKSLSEWG